MTDSLDESKKIADWGETQRALAKLAPRNHFGLQLFVLPEKKPLTDADLAPGMHQRLPGKARFIELANKQRFHLAGQCADLRPSTLGFLSVEERTALQSVEKEKHVPDGNRWIPPARSEPKLHRKRL